MGERKGRHKMNISKKLIKPSSVKISEIVWSRNASAVSFMGFVLLYCCSESSHPWLLKRSAVQICVRMKWAKQGDLVKRGPIFHIKKVHHLDPSQHFTARMHLSLMWKGSTFHTNNVHHIYTRQSCKHFTAADAAEGHLLSCYGQVKRNNNKNSPDIS